MIRFLPDLLIDPAPVDRITRHAYTLRALVGFWARAPGDSAGLSGRAGSWREVCYV